MIAPSSHPSSRQSHVLMSDVLSDILDTVNLKATLYFRAEFHPPFRIAVPPFKLAARFHLVVQGQCHISLDGGTTVVATPGDLVLVPHGNAHLLASGQQGAVKTLENVLDEWGPAGPGPFVVGNGPDNQSCKMICGHFNFADGSDHPVLRAVPDILHISATSRATQPMLDDVLRLIVRRAWADDAGAASSIARLSEVLFIEVIRAGLSRLDRQHEIMTAIRDPQIGRALSLVHADLAKPWTVETLAGAVGMSRSRFAGRFRELVGSGPMAYLAEWRLQRALHLLGSRKYSVKAAASLVGFRSAAAFSRAFAERFGRTPRQQRLNEAEQ